ncbi:hypothetical protein MSIBF_A730003 [groundwater metagenome]|uniref:Uncharacterized protein n=1 Tax=groundwater metagenome TaxID=717931 RepID=A0A098ED45_9ZZZZ
MNYTAQRQKLRFLLNGILYVAYEQEIYSLLTLRFHKFEKTQSVKLGSIVSQLISSTQKIGDSRMKQIIEGILSPYNSTIKKCKNN